MRKTGRETPHWLEAQSGAVTGKEPPMFEKDWHAERRALYIKGLIVGTLAGITIGVPLGWLFPA